MKLLAAFISLSMLACGDSTRDHGRADVDSGGKVDDPFAETSDVAPEPSDEWTVLVYMAADNDLEQAGLDDLAEMVAAAAAGGVRFAVQVDRSAGMSSEPFMHLGDWSSAKRLVIDRLGVRELADLGEVNMADPHVLADFLAWADADFTSGRRALVFWNHGAGWTGFASDDLADADQPTLSVPDLQRGLADTTHFDLIGFDACLMATVEVARGLAPYGDYLLASQEVEPGHGWDYRVFADAGADAAALASTIIDGFFTQAAAEGTDAAITLSLVDLTRIDVLTDALDALATRLDALAEPVIVGRARGAALRFGQAPDLNYDWHLIDVGDFAGGLATSAISAEVEALKAALASVVRDNRYTNGTRHATGLSVYFPPTRAFYDARYDALTESTAWRTFLGHYYAAGVTIDTPVDLSAARATAEWTADGALLRVDTAAAAVANVVERRGYGGFVVGADDARIYASFPVTLAGAEVQVPWGGEAAMVSQGELFEICYVDYYFDRAANQWYVDVPFLYVSPAGEPTYVVRKDLLQADGTPAGRAKWFRFTDTGAGELVPEPGGLVVALYRFISERGMTWEESILAFDPTRPIDFEFRGVFDLLIPSDVLYLALEARDYAGNIDSVHALLPAPSPAEP